MKDGNKMPTMYFVWWRRIPFPLTQSSVTQLFVMVVEAKDLDLTTKSSK